MALRLNGHIALPANQKPGGFDHAAVHRASGKLYVAHTCNDALDVIDCATDGYVHSIPNLTGVAGALVSDEHDLLFTSNRGENTVSIFSANDETRLAIVGVGIRPNGLAYAPQLNRLLAANVGDPDIPNSYTLSIVDVSRGAMTESIPVPGRTRWTLFDAQAGAFYVNIADPPQIVVVDGGDLTRVARSFAIPVTGPHGLDLDVAQARLFCACDGKQLLTVDAHSGKVTQQAEIGGAPDVIFFNAALQHLYVAIGDPGTIEVFDTRALERIETVETEKGAHTLAFDAARNKVYAFMPQTHRAAVYVDE